MKLISTELSVEPVSQHAQTLGLLRQKFGKRTSATATAAILIHVRAEISSAAPVGAIESVWVRGTAWPSCYS